MITLLFRGVFILLRVFFDVCAFVVCLSYHPWQFGSMWSRGNRFVCACLVLRRLSVLKASGEWANPMDVKGRVDPAIRTAIRRGGMLILLVLFSVTSLSLLAVCLFHFHLHAQRSRCSNMCKVSFRIHCTSWLREESGPTALVASLCTTSASKSPASLMFDIFTLTCLPLGKAISDFPNRERDPCRCPFRHSDPCRDVQLEACSQQPSH